MNKEEFLKAIYSTPLYSEMKLNVMDSNGNNNLIENVAKINMYSHELEVILLDGTKKKHKLLKGFRVNGIDPEDYGYNLSTGGCYLTTACTKARGLEDDCYELSVLRDYRDNYLIESQNGVNDVHRYYELAPKILKKIESHENSDIIYEGLYNDLIIPCINLIEDNKHYEAHQLYKEITLGLEDKYLM